MPNHHDRITLERILPPVFHAALRGAPAVAEAPVDAWIFERLNLLGATARGDGMEPIDARQKLQHFAEHAKTAPSEAMAWGRMRAMAVADMHAHDPTTAADPELMTYMRLWRAVCIDLSDACMRVGNAIAHAIPDATFEPDSDHGGDEELRWSGAVVRGGDVLLWIDATLQDATVQSDADRGCGLSITTHYLGGIPGPLWLPYHYTDLWFTDDASELRRRLTRELDVDSFADAAVRDHERRTAVAPPAAAAPGV